MITTAEALQSLEPNSNWVIRDGVIEWLSDGITQPTSAEVDAEVIRLQGVYDAQAYARSRKAEYPTIADQLDDIYHNGIDAWKATIKVTKDKYPKE
jgi:hypothetical protein